MKDVRRDPVRKELPRWRKGRGGEVASQGRPSEESFSPFLAPPQDLQAPEVLERCFKELVRYYRHSGVGRVCRGIAHQMNGPLQVISFLQELLEQKSQEEREILLEGPDSAPEKLAKSLAYCREKIGRFRCEVEKLQDLARNLVQHGVHEKNQEAVYLDLNRLYRQELELYLAQPFFKHQVDKDFRLLEGLPPIYGHYIDFSQSFRNLMDNALEAMEGAKRRRLTVETALEDKRRVLRIGDTGVGFAPEIGTRLFAPFLTTKGPDHAGLGLFMTRRLLTPYNADIRIDCVPGETWVTVYLPLD
jgi:two-component system, NtrC family, sensor kinase